MIKRPECTSRDLLFKFLDFFCIFGMAEARYFTFATQLQLEPCKYQPTDDKLSISGAWTLFGVI